MTTNIRLNPTDYNARGRNDWFRARLLDVAGLQRGEPNAYVSLSAYSDRGQLPNFAPLHLQLTPAEARTLARVLLAEATAAETKPTAHERDYGRPATEEPVVNEPPFVWIKVEGGLADYGGDTDIVSVAQVDYDISENLESSIEDLETMLAEAQRIPDRLANLPRGDRRWLDKAGIIATIAEDLEKNRAAYEEVPV
jgi:hypothetical protein